MPLPAFLLPLAAGLVGGGVAGAALGGGNKKPATPGQPNAGSFWTGTPDQTHLFSRYRPETQQRFDKLIGNILGQYEQGAFDFSPIQEYYTKNFEERTVPTLAERFTAMGGGQKSSAFQQSLGQAGADLNAQLAAMGSQYGLEQQRLLQNLIQLGGAESVFQPKQPGFLQQAGSAAIPAGLMALRAYLGGA